MKLIFQKPYKSIQSLEQLELPDFVVLTGVNGAGKSHLLEAIELGAISVDGVPPNQARGAKPTRRFDSATLVTQDTGAFSGSQISTELAGYWDNVRQHWSTQAESFYSGLRSLGIPGIEKMEPRDIVRLDMEALGGFGLSEEAARAAVQQIRNQSQNIENNVTSMFVQQDPNNRQYLIKKFNDVKRIPIFAMNQDDFYEAYPDNWQQVDLFQQSFARLFSAYQRNWRANELRARGQLKGANISALSESEFLGKYGEPPWKFLNEVLEVANLDFRINSPFQWDDRPYEPVLTDEKRDIRVKFADLSSGERVLMSFALCLYHVSDPRASIDYPKVLLFDEIDAPLHPSMTGSLLRTIETTLVRDRNIKVILTTHSPSTVAMSPNESIFAMSKSGPHRVKACSKDAALGILTSGVPTLSVNYENRRQIFVESKYDVNYYSSLYQLSRTCLYPDISMTFIASGAGGNGNCDQVISIVEQLRTAGNKTVLGVIDWDAKNEPREWVLVLGYNDRYSIENYILDPLLVGLLLLREKMIEPVDLGLDKSKGYFQGGAPALISIARAVAAKLISRLPAGTTDLMKPASLSYSDGTSIEVPKWPTSMQGHALEAALKEAYPPLFRYRNESDLKMAIISRVLDDRPELVPAAVVATLRAIQVGSGWHKQ